MEEMEAAVGEVGGLRDTPSGTVRLRLPRLACATLVESVLGRFAEAYPDIRLELAIDDARTDIVAAGFDLGITLGELLEKDMVAVRLGADIHQVAVASPDYLARHGTPETPADLHAHRCINWRKPSSGKLYNWEFMKDGQWFAVAVDGPLTVSHRDVALAAAAQGVGIAFAYWSDRWLRPRIEAGELVPLLEAWSPPFPGWHLYYPRHATRTPAVRALVDFLKAEDERRSSAALLQGQPAGEAGEGDGREPVSQLKKGSARRKKRPEPPHRHDEQPDPGQRHEGQRRAEHEALQNE